MLVPKYLNYDEVMSYNMRHNFIVGDRGVGKTYGLTRWLLNKCVSEGRKFIWVRNTKSTLDEMTKFDGMGFLADHPEKLGLDRSLFTVSKGILFYGEQMIGAFVSLGNFFSIKGVNYDDVTYFIFDEFMPERREAIRVDYDYALKSILQSVFRERINFRAFYMANVLTTSNSILDFFKFNITPTFPGQIIQRNPKLSAIIFYLQNIKRDGDRDVLKGDAFALANKYTETSLIINYEKNVDAKCAQQIKRDERIAYLAGDQTYFLLRQFGDKVAIIAVKKPSEQAQLPCYALHKTFVFGDVIFDAKVKAQMLKFWNTGGLIFKSHYSLYQFTKGLFTQ